MDWEQGALLLVHAAMGISLAACAGLRAFLPLLVVGVAGRLDWIPLSESFEWLAGWPALAVFGAAVVSEILADKFPVVDHFLDGVQTFVKPVAGALVMATVVQDWAPLYLAVLLIVSGGAVSGIVHVTKAQLRLGSTLGTAGLGNPVLSVSEDFGALVGATGAIFVPVLMAVAVVVGLVGAWVLYRRWRGAPVRRVRPA